MSDLIITAQAKALVGLQNFATSLAERAREQRGQTAAEYMGILFIVMVIIAAVFTSHLDTKIADRVSTIVTNIGNGTK
jgi:pilus assembly protein Flp/PilA